MASYALDVLGRVACSSKTRQKRMPQVMESQRPPIGKRGDSFSQFEPLHGSREIAAIEWPATRARENVIEPGLLCLLEPWHEFVEDRHAADVAALRGANLQFALTVGRERAPHCHESLTHVYVLPSEADQFPEAQPGESEASKCALTRGVKLREREHPCHLYIAQSAAYGVGFVSFAA